MNDKIQILSEGLFGERTIARGSACDNWLISIRYQYLHNDEWITWQDSGASLNKDELNKLVEFARSIGWEIK